MNDQWTHTTLGEILTLEYGKSLPKHVRSDGPFPVFGSNGVVGWHDDFHVRGPGILVGRKGTAGSVTWSADSFFPIDTTYWVRLRDDERVSLRFAFLLLSHCDLPHLSAQTGVPGLNRDRAYAVEVDLPPLVVQRRIVDLMEHLDTHVDALRRKHAASQRLLQSWRESHFSSPDLLGSTVRFADITKDSRHPTAVAPDETCSEIGVRSHGRGVFGKEAKTGKEVGSKKLFKVSSGDLVFNIVFAWEGAVAVIPSDFDGWYSSHRFPTFRRTDGGDVEYLRQFFVSSRGLAALGMASPGGAGRNRTLGRLALAEVLIPSAGLKAEARFLEIAVDLERHEKALVDEIAALSTARSTCLRELLSGNREIPASYDSLLVVS